MAGFAQDLGGTETPVNIKSPVVDTSMSELISGVGTAAHLKIANDTADLIAAARAAKSGAGTPPVTPDELKQIDYEALTAAYDQKQISAAEYDARLKANIRRFDGSAPHRARAMNDFYSYTKTGSTLITDEEAASLGRAQAITDISKASYTLAGTLQTTPQVAGKILMNAEESRRNLEQYQTRTQLGIYEGADQVKKAVAVLPDTMSSAMSEIFKIASEHGGRIPPNKLFEATTRSLNAFQNERTKLAATLPPGTDMAEYNKAADNYSETLKTVINQLDASNIEGKNSAAVSSILAVEGAKAFPMIAALNSAGGQQAVGRLFDIASNPAYADQIMKNNPQFAAYMEKSGRLASDVLSDIHSKLALDTPVSSYDPTLRRVLGQSVVNAIASPGGTDKADPILVPKSTELVRAGDVNVAKAWFTPGAIAKVNQSGPVGEHNKQIMTQTMQSVEAAAVSEIVDGGYSLSYSDQTGISVGNVPLLDAATSALSGSAPGMAKIKILADYARTYPEIAVGDGALSGQAAVKAMYDRLSTRIDKLKSGTVQRPSSTAPNNAPTPSGVDFSLDAEGNVIGGGNK